MMSPPIISHYVDLPPDYKDETGLPFGADLSDTEARRIFGPRVDTALANRLLRILHGRRVAGTLDDPDLQQRTAKFMARFTEDQRETALAWLRTNAPVDEVINAGLRAEDELAALEEVEAEEEEEGGEGPDARARAGEDAKQEEVSPPGAGRGWAEKFEKWLYKQKQTGGDVYGEGAFDKIRARNIQKAKVAEALREQEEKKKRKREEEGAAGVTGPLARMDSNKPRELSPRMREWTRRATSDLKAPPEMAKWERLLPSAVFVALCLGFLFAYANFYQAPEVSERLYQDIPPSVATVGVLIMANTVVWCLWRVPPLWRVLNRYFAIVPATPKPTSMLLYMFSHQKVGHLATNMAVFALLGTQLHNEVGRGYFLATFLGSGLLAGLGSLGYFVLTNQLTTFSLGASAAWYGTAVAYFWLHRWDGFKVFGLPPDPAHGVQGLGFIGLFTAVNLAGVASPGVRKATDLAAHFAGIAAGLLIGSYLEKKKEEGEGGRLAEPEVDPASSVWHAYGLYGYFVEHVLGIKEVARPVKPAPAAAAAAAAAADVGTKER